MGLRMSAPIFIHITRSAPAAVFDIASLLTSRESSLCGEYGPTTIQASEVKLLTADEMDSRRICPFCVLRMIARDGG